MAIASSLSPRAIGADLAACRLDSRARRIQFAIDELRHLIDARSQRGAAPPALLRALADFSEELDDVERKRAELGPL